MIKVYNKHTQYLKIGDKVIAPFKVEEFEERNQQIRILERNGVVSVTEVLENTTTETVKTEVEPVVSATEEVQIVEPTIEIVEEEVKTEQEEIVEEVEETKIEEKEVVEQKPKKKRTNKKGGNK